MPRLLAAAGVGQKSLSGFDVDRSAEAAFTKGKQVRAHDQS
jgi:hypothetical protein